MTKPVAQVRRSGKKNKDGLVRGVAAASVRPTAAIEADVVSKGSDELRKAEDHRKFLITLGECLLQQERRRQDYSPEASKEYYDSVLRLMTIFALVWTGLFTKDQPTWVQNIAESAGKMMFPIVARALQKMGSLAYLKGAWYGHWHAFWYRLGKDCPNDVVQKVVRENPVIQQLREGTKTDMDSWCHEEWEVIQQLYRGYADALCAETVKVGGKLAREKGNRLDVYLKLWENRDTVNAAVHRREKREWLYAVLFPKSTISWHSFEKACEAIGLLSRE